MLVMSDPLVDVSELAVYLNDPNIDTVRATALIGRAQTLCESVVSPLPDAAAVVVERVAGRAYVTVTSARQAQLAAGGSPFGGAPAGVGGVRLDATDRADLIRIAADAAGGSAGSFSIDMLPVGFVAPVIGAPTWGDFDRLI